MNTTVEQAELRPRPRTGPAGSTTPSPPMLGSPPPDSDTPLIRSGLALVGASVRAAPDGEDGILTALEIAKLDLSGAEMVVLSTCETGVGDVDNREGVYGLR